MIKRSNIQDTRNKKIDQLCDHLKKMKKRVVLEDSDDDEFGTFLTRKKQKLRSSSFEG